MSDDSQTPEVLFENIASFIARSRILLEQGAVMEMAGLDAQVRVLCEQVLSMSQDERVQHAAKLQFLLNELKTLGAALAQQRDTVSAEIRGMSGHRKASVAYKVADATDEYGNKNG